MRSLISFAIALIVASAALVFADTAYAQATRTWVSGVGDDVNPCSRTAPCKTFAGAISKTATRGEINCLDSAGFGAVTITKSISIVCNGVIGGILAAGTNGVVINLPTATDRATLEGLDIDGAGTGLDGVRMVGLGSVTILKTTIRGFTSEAIELNGGANARAMVADSYITYNAGGVTVGAVGANVNAAFLLNVIMDANTAFAVKVGPNDTVAMSNSFLGGSAASIISVVGSVVQSYGNNIIRNSGVPNQTLPLQ